MHTEEEAAGLAAARRMFDADRASAGLGIEVVGLGPGWAAARMRVTGSMLNGHGIGHGGYVFLLADTAFALACNSHGSAAVAAGADVSFLAAVAEGDVLTARAVERGVYGRSGIYDVTVSRGRAGAARLSDGPAIADKPDISGISDMPVEADVLAEEIVAEFRGRSRVVAGR